MTVRPAHPGDAPAIAKIWNQIIQETAITFTDQTKSVSEVAEKIKKAPVFVAEPKGQVIGFATFGPFRAGPGYARTAEHSIYINTSAQRGGVGRALMQTVEDTARAQGITTLVACIGGEALGSVAFHTALGFEKVGHLSGIGWKFGRAHDLILMQKRL